MMRVIFTIRLLARTLVIEVVREAEDVVDDVRMTVDLLVNHNC